MKKVKAVFQRDLDLFEFKMKSLGGLLGDLRRGDVGEFLRRLLGDDGYRELILLEVIRPVTQKRLAEEEPDDASKRHKVLP